MDRRSTPEQDAVDRESAGFAVRTTIDDVIGKLHYVRGQIFMDVPDGVASGMDDVDELVERIIGLVEDLPGRPEEAYLAAIDALRPRPTGMLTGSRPRRSGATAALHD
jgi:hypothetical protein